MTVTNQTPYTLHAADGVATVYPYDFRLLDADDLEVTLDGVAITGYTISGIGDAGGGDLTFGSPPAAGQLLIRRVVRAVREIDYQYVGKFPHNVVNSDFDRLWMAIQGVNDVLSRTFSLPPGYADLTVAAPAAGEFLRWNLAGTGVESAPAVYDNGNFLQSGTGAVERTVDSKLGEVVSLADFGAVGDGATNDTAAVAAAIAVQRPLLWIGTGGNTFRIASSILQTVTSDVIWYGRGARIVYDGAHAEYAIRLNDTAGVKFLINDLTVDGGKLCNKPLEVLNNTSMSTASKFIASNLYVKRAKRSNAFSGGDGINIKGAFEKVVFNGGGASDCELPSGQGTATVVGITGITVTYYSATAYVRRLVVNGVTVEKIYSSDLSYQYDQDGIRYFAPDDPGGTYKVPSDFVCMGGSRFANCYGRSIKTKVRSTFVTDSRFERDQGLTSGQGNDEVDAQEGSIAVARCVFVYSNGQEPGVCVSGQSDAAYGRTGMTVRDCEVYVEAGTTLDRFARNFPNSGFFSRHVISNIKIFGAVKKLFDFLCNGDENYAEVSNCYTDTIVNGETSQKALIYVRASGSTTPRNAIVTAYGNVHADTDLPAIVRDNVSGTAVSSTLSAWGNVGFANELTADTTVAGLKVNQVARLGKITGVDGGRAFIDVISKVVSAGATETFSIANGTGCLVFIQVRKDNTTYAFISSTASNNTSIAAGAAFNVGNNSNPGSGTFRVWSSGTREISVQNNDASDRVVSVFVLSP